jgi:hypothetical protein
LIERQTLSDDATHGDIEAFRIGHLAIVEAVHLLIKTP